MERGRQKDFRVFPINMPAAPKNCPWINSALDADSDSCTIFFVQGIKLPSAARLVPPPIRMARPEIRRRGAFEATTLAQLEKTISHSQEDARKK